MEGPGVVCVVPPGSDQVGEEANQLDIALRFAPGHLRSRLRANTLVMGDLSADEHLELVRFVAANAVEIVASDRDRRLTFDTSTPGFEDLVRFLSSRCKPEDGGRYVVQMVANQILDLAQWSCVLRGRGAESKEYWPTTARVVQL